MKYCHLRTYSWRRLSSCFQHQGGTFPHQVRPWWPHSFHQFQMFVWGQQHLRLRSSSPFPSPPSHIPSPTQQVHTPCTPWKKCRVTGTEMHTCSSLEGLRCCLKSRWPWSLRSPLCDNLCSWKPAFPFILYLDTWEAEGSYLHREVVTFPQGHTAVFLVQV